MNFIFLKYLNFIYLSFKFESNTIIKFNYNRKLVLNNLIFLIKIILNLIKYFKITRAESSNFFFFFFPISQLTFCI